MWAVWPIWPDGQRPLGEIEVNKTKILLSSVGGWSDSTLQFVQRYRCHTEMPVWFSSVPPRIRGAGRGLLHSELRSGKSETRAAFPGSSPLLQGWRPCSFLFSLHKYAICAVGVAPDSVNVNAQGRDIIPVLTHFGTETGRQTAGFHFRDAWKAGDRTACKYAREQIRSSALRLRRARNRKARSTLLPNQPGVRISCPVSPSPDLTAGSLCLFSRPSRFARIRPVFCPPA